MIYEYICNECKASFDVVKPMAEYAREEHCPRCKSVADRLWSKNITLHKTKVKDAEYYHSLGVVVKNDYHRSELIKKHNLVEIGSERADRAREYMNKDRLERMKKRWEGD